MKAPTSKLSKLSPGLYISESNSIIQVGDSGDIKILDTIQGPPGPPGPQGDIDMNEILYMIREEVSMAIPPQKKNEWVFDVKRNDKGLIETVVARK
jgi:hypothetical protein